MYLLVFVPFIALVKWMMYPTCCQCICISPWYLSIMHSLAHVLKWWHLIIMQITTINFAFQVRNHKQLTSLLYLFIILMNMASLSYNIWLWSIWLYSCIQGASLPYLPWTSQFVASSVRLWWKATGMSGRIIHRCIDYINCAATRLGEKYMYYRDHHDQLPQAMCSSHWSRCRYRVNSRLVL